jgi:glucose-1-phosphate adenylyltransferase
MSRKPDRALVSMGIYIFDAQFLLDRLTQDALKVESSHDFGKDIMPSILQESRIFGYAFTDIDDHTKQGYWRDVGTIDAYWQANLELADVVPELNLYDERWPIWTRQEQVPPAKFVFDKRGSRGCAVDSLVSDGCIVSGAAVHRSVLFTHARACEGSTVSESLLLPGAVIGERCIIKRAIIDAGCHIPDGSVIGEDAEADAQRYFRTEAGITLVTKDMLPAGRM